MVFEEFYTSGLLFVLDILQSIHKLMSYLASGLSILALGRNGRSKLILSKKNGAASDDGIEIVNARNNAMNTTDSIDALMIWLFAILQISENGIQLHIIHKHKCTTGTVKYYCRRCMLVPILQIVKTHTVNIC